ncbi:MAG: hypothetical protein BRD50_01510 [Bacteroidetes bacterium SW_11_45_7]|nr:MAG: hypothetical protein BRD50_01510 [Bacteroidetes bacterium SW_11_45_7]
MTLITSIITVALMTASLSNVTTLSGENRSKVEIQQEVVNHLSVPDFCREGDKHYVAVRFRINEEGKLQVLEVSGSDQKLGDYVKKQLEGASMDLSDYETGTSYMIPIRFQKL